MLRDSIRVLLCIGLVAVLGSCAGNAQRSSDDSDYLSPQAKSLKAARINTELGQRYLRRGNLEVAFDKLRTALDFDPDYGPAHTVIAVLYQRIGRPDQAERHYRRAVELQPDKGAVNNNLGQFLCSSGRYEESLQYFRKAVADPFYATPEAAYINAGACLMNANHPQQATEQLRKALVLRPDNAEALYQMAGALAAQDKFFDASAFIQRFDALGKPSPAALLLGYQIETGLGKSDAARKYAKRLRDEFPESDEARSLSDASPP